MMTNKDPANSDAPDSRKNPGLQHGALSNGASGNVGNRQADEIANEDVMSSREDSITAREDVVHSREKVIQEADALKAAVEDHIAKLRKANEQLVITTIEAQTMTEEMTEEIQTMAEEVQKAKDQMEHMAHHDFLTDLPNRILFKERLIQAISLAKRHGTKLAVLFMDLDRFKTINDSLGHAIGDTLLQAVAHRLLSCIRGADTVSRHGGDEFVALLSEVADEKSVSALANKMCKTVTAPYAFADQNLHIGVTIGISMYPDDAADAETLIRNADVAMYHAKNNGGNSYLFFAPEMNARVVERQRTEGELHRALEQHEFVLYYQAQVELQTGNIIGAEALIRWRHPDRGLLLPGLFVPIAEQCGAIVPIGRWVLREACRQMQAWLDAGLVLPTVAVNVSALEFGRGDFLGSVHAALRDAHLAPCHLELELTETLLMKNAASTMTMLQELKSMGVTIAIDDFGTGYSSLSYLKQFPVDTLKIDRSFVAGIVRNDDDDILVDAVIGLGKSLRRRVIAEGIETREQLAFLSGHHCAEGQGNYLTPPMIAEEFSALLKAGLSADLLPRAASLH